MPVFFIDESQVRNGAVRITGPLLRHLHGSLRVEPGEELMFVVPGQCRYQVRVDRVDSNTLVGPIVNEQSPPPLPCPQVLLAQSLLKGDRMDWVIQKSTELGVAQIIPLVTRQSVVRPKSDRMQTQRERWNRIALEAAQQAERWESPPITVPMDAFRFFEDHGDPECRMILSERTSGQSMSSISLPVGSSEYVVIAVGPEGGWQTAELDHAQTCGFVAITLGSRILRAETAGLAALTILQNRLGQLG